jgi:hypothetical protein
VAKVRYLINIGGDIGLLYDDIWLIIAHNNFTEWCESQYAKLLQIFEHSIIILMNYLEVSYGKWYPNN